MKEHFLLDSETTFLNFGSFGACPKPVFKAYQDFQVLLEKNPVQFIVKIGPELLNESRKVLAEFIDCDFKDFVFVQNPSYAVNVIVKSLKFKSGDEVLTTDLEYGACDRTWNFYANERGFVYKRQAISLPIQSKEQFLDEFWKGYSDKTKLVFISQITSATGLILPVKEIVEEAKKRGLMTFVDGAHVPAHIPLSLNELDPDFYTGACHKWMMTPKGSSFMYVRSELQHIIDPLIVSWGYDADYPTDSQFYDYHQFNGTRDFSAYLTIPSAIDFMQQHNWLEKTKFCYERTLFWVQKLSELLDSKPLAPLTNDFYGLLGSLEITCENPIDLKNILYDKYQIEIPVMVHNGKTYIRFSYHPLNSERDLERLYEVLKELKSLNQIR
ncbi:MAG: aminotransferase class V-fold PLP-dependent enzyme [Fluviicola sp.]